MDAVLYVVDLSRVTASYRDALGLTVVDIREGSTDLRCGGSTLHLVGVPPSVAEDIVIAVPPVRREEAPIKLVVPVDDLAAARQRAAEHGGVVDGPAYEWAWKSSVRVDAVDPEGNVVQLVSRRPSRTPLM